MPKERLRHRLKADYKKLEHDFLTMTKIAGLMSTLNCEYQVRLLCVLVTIITLLIMLIAHIPN